MNPILTGLFLLLPCACFAGERFQLLREIRTNYVEGSSTTRVLTGYTYNSDGNRVLARIWDGTDTTVPTMSSVKYTYNTSGGIEEEVLLSGSDTLAIVRNAYTGGRLVSIRVLRKDGSPRFYDSIIYNQQGLKVEQRRLNASAAMAYYHKFTYNAMNRVATDTLFEPVSGIFSPVQAVVFAYNADSTVVSETHWLLAGGEWNCMSTAFMGYASGALAWVTTRERDGVGTRLLDSLAFTSDVFGNRLQEEHFNSDSEMTYRIVMSWKDTNPQTIAGKHFIARDTREFSVIAHNGVLTIRTPIPGNLAIYSFAGKKLGSFRIEQHSIIPLSGICGKGRYLVVFSGIAGSSVSQLLM